jgi:hypothetical protein
MAKGADEEYWASPNLPGKIKHCMMGKYVPIFLGRTGSKAGKVLSWTATPAVGPTRTAPQDPPECFCSGL